MAALWIILGLVYLASWIAAIIAIVMWNKNQVKLIWAIVGLFIPFVGFYAMCIHPRPLFVDNLLNKKKNKK